MHLRNQVLSLAAFVVLAFASCKKDVTATEDQPVNADLIASNSAADDVPETARPVVKTYNTYINNNSGSYYEILPARYFLTTKNYPLIIFLHGIGELGQGSPARIGCCGLPYYASRGLFPAQFVVGGQKYSFIVVAPQFKVRAKPVDVQAAIEFAVKKYRVDVSRIYVAGLSLGGGSTWDFTSVYGQNAAAVLPVCGGTAPSQTLAKSIASKNVPVWTIHSNTDRMVPISFATNWINWIKAANPIFASNYKVTILYGGEDHNTSWAKAFNPVNRWDGYNVYEWLLRFKRTGGIVVAPPAPAPTPTPTPTPTPVGNKMPGAVAGPDQSITYYTGANVTLDASASKDPDGTIVSYLWEKIGGAPTYKIISPYSAQTKVTFTHTGTYVFRVTTTDNKGMKNSDYMFVVVK